MKMPRPRFRRDHVGIVFQNFHLVPTMTAPQTSRCPSSWPTTPTPWRVPARGWPRSALPARMAPLSGPALRRGAAAGWRLPGPSPASPASCSPTSRPAVLDGATGGAVIRLLYDLHHRRNATLLLITPRPGGGTSLRPDRRDPRRPDRWRPPHHRGEAVRRRAMTRLALAWRLARRELRGGIKGFRVFLACLTLGVAAIAAVASR